MVMNSLPRWLISITDMPLPRQSSISSCARASTCSGSIAGPALKLYTRIASCLACSKWFLGALHGSRTRALTLFEIRVGPRILAAVVIDRVGRLLAGGSLGIAVHVLAIAVDIGL